MKGYQLKITIKGSKPPIWRRVVVPEQITFYQLHQVIQEAFGWWNAHLHEFEFKKLGLIVRDPGEEDRGRGQNAGHMGEDSLIDRLIEENPRFVYTYDFEDTWEHQILFEKEIEYGERYPQVLKYKGDNIPEDCKGIGDYYDLLEHLADPEDGKHDEMESRSRQHGMEEYDLEAVNAGMRAKLVFDRGHKKAEGGRQKAEKAAETLEEIFSRYDKSELLAIARVHHIKECDGLGKIKLIPMLAEELLRPARMGRFFSCVSDEGAAEFEKAAESGGLEYHGDLEALRFLNHSGYCAFTDGRVAVVSKDVAAAYDEMNTEEFHCRRHHCYTVWACIKAAVYLYGAADARRVESVCRAAGSDADAEEITGQYKEMKDIWTDFAYLDGLFFDWDLLGKDAYKEVLRYQQGMEDYIPTPAQVKEIAQTGITEPKKHVRPLKAFLLAMVGCDEETAGEAAGAIHNHVRLGGSPQGVEEIMERYDLTLDTQEKMKGFDEIMAQVWKDTRRVGYCGCTRAELDAKTAHVAPDAPCPCGSGKRYRQCCGRK